MLSKAKTLQAVLEMQKLFPDAHCELDHQTPFQLLIATILSAQATDKGVNKVTPKLFAIYPNAHALANSEEEVVIECIQSLGLYRNKAKNIRLCAQQLVERFNGEVPRTREELVQLAGVGRKTANVVLSVAFGLPAFAVDTHVERICKHHDIVKKSATPLEVEKRVMEVLPPEEWLAAHQAMIYFGRAICHPKNPECEHYPQLYDFSSL